MHCVSTAKLIANCFNKLHEQLSMLRSHVDSLEDPEAHKMMNAMEFGLLAPMRRLRIHLDIPYDWRDEKMVLPESVK